MEKKSIHTTRYFFLLLGLCWLFTAHSVFAKVTYIPMTTIPGVSNTGSIVELVNAAYMLLIVFGATLGVLRIAYAGFRHSMSDVVTTKTDARGEIKSVFFGLFILVIPFLVLKTIYPNLVNLDVLKNITHTDNELVNPYEEATVQSRESLEDACISNGSIAIYSYYTGNTNDSSDAYLIGCTPPGSMTNDPDCMIQDGTRSYTCLRTRPGTSCSVSDQVCQRRCKTTLDRQSGVEQGIVYCNSI